MKITMLYIVIIIANNAVVVACAQIKRDNTK